MHTKLFIPARLCFHFTDCFSLTATVTYSSLSQTWYKTLVPNTTYVVDVWLRQQGLAVPQVRFSLGGFYNFYLAPFNVTTSWGRFTATFTVPTIYTSGTGVGTMALSFTGPGEVRFVVLTPSIRLCDLNDD
jgi:hypothetical protein